MAEHEVTRADEVAVPLEVVELAHLRTKNGDPVRVLCGGADELVLQRVMRALPGSHPPALEDDAGTGEEAETQVEHLKLVAPALLEAGTAFSDGAGGEVRPAFWWDPAKRVPGSVPGRLLRIEDLSALVTAVLRASGYVAAPGGGPESGAFHGRERGGPALRVEPVPTGAGHGPDAVGSGARPAPRVQRNRAARAR